MTPPSPRHDVDSPAALRHAGRGLLSLALIDARNRSLRWLAAFEEAPPLAASAEFDPPLWRIGQIAWFQERWVARNVQRQRGERCDPQVLRLASIEPMADALFDAAGNSRAQRWQAIAATPPDGQALRRFLADTIEVTLDLLERSTDDDDDAALYFYRLALFHEDRSAEALAETAQAAGVGPPAGVWPQPPAGASGGVRPPLLFPATRWAVGVARDSTGFRVDNEMPAHEVALPEFEIDAQPVSWSQYGEFVADGGYDERGHWSADGWDWLQRDGRRVPRYVEQMRAGVLRRRFGAAMRVAPQQPALHLTAHEADAWCRWAGRRLPFEAEWDCAARSGGARGFAWGAVREWTASRFGAYPSAAGFVAGPWAEFSQAAFGGGQRVLRGASAFTPRRLHDATLRGFLPPAHDLAFTGFRSCAV